jgi:general stress protein 26
MTAHDPAAVQTRLWDEIEKRRTGMLGLMSDNQHFQPMTAFLDREAQQIWFFTYNDTDLAQAIASGGGHAMFVFQEKDLQACIGGRLSLSHDPERMARYWNPMVAAWYPEGKEDPRLTLLRFDCEDAQVWLTEAGPVRYFFEVAKANATKSRPDLGERRDLNFH